VGEKLRSWYGRFRPSQRSGEELADRPDDRIGHRVHEHLEQLPPDDAEEAALRGVGGWRRPRLGRWNPEALHAARASGRGALDLKLVVQGKVPGQHPRLVAGEHELATVRPEVGHLDLQHLLAVAAPKGPRGVGRWGGKAQMDLGW
jgi:hypothetical protein